MPPPTPPSASALPALLSKIRTILPSSIPKSAAYIMPASTLTALGHPNLLGPLFLHVTGNADNKNTTSASNTLSTPSHQPSGAGPIPRPGSPAGPTATTTPDEATTRTISLHLRDMLLKEWTLIGIPLVITAVASLGAAEREAGLFPPPTLARESSSSNTTTTTTTTTELPSTSSRTYTLGTTSTLSPRYADPDLNNPAPGTALHARGTQHLTRLYRQHLPAIMATWGSHEADFRWLEESVIYGLFLSDHGVLTDLETSLVVLSGIIAQGLKGPSLWHLRGLRRLGVSRGDVEAVVRAVGEVVAWAGGRVEGASGREGEVEEWVGWVGEVEAEV